MSCVSRLGTLLLSLFLIREILLCRFSRAVIRFRLVVFDSLPFSSRSTPFVRWWFLLPALAGGPKTSAPSSAVPSTNGFSFIAHIAPLLWECSCPRCRLSGFDTVPTAGQSCVIFALRINQCLNGWCPHDRPCGDSSFVSSHLSEFRLIGQRVDFLWISLKERLRLRGNSTASTQHPSTLKANHFALFGIPATFLAPAAHVSIP